MKEITPRVYADLNRQDYRPGAELAIALLHQRTEQGISEYGRPLRTGDGHDWLQLLVEEILDAAQYSQGALMEGVGDRPKLQKIYSHLLEAAMAIAEMQARNTGQKTDV